MGDVERIGEKRVCLELDLEKKLRMESIGENIFFDLGRFPWFGEVGEPTFTLTEVFTEPENRNG